MTVRPNWMLVVGDVVVIAGFCLPWFKQGSGYLWSYSGWTYLTNSSGPGWPIAVLVFGIVSILAALVAHNDDLADTASVVFGVGAGVLAILAVAMAFGATGSVDSTNEALTRPIGPGMFVLAVGVGLIVAATRPRTQRTPSPPPPS